MKQISTKRHDWVGNVINLEIVNKVKSDHMNKLYMHNQEWRIGNELHKIFKDFEIETDYLILARWSDLVIVYKKRKPAK